MNEEHRAEFADFKNTLRQHHHHGTPSKGAVMKRAIALLHNQNIYMKDMIARVRLTGNTEGLGDRFWRELEVSHVIRPANDMPPLALRISQLV